MLLLPHIAPLAGSAPSAPQASVHTHLQRRTATASADRNTVGAHRGCLSGEAQLPWSGCLLRFLSVLHPFLQPPVKMRHMATPCGSQNSRHIQAHPAKVDAQSISLYVENAIF